MQLTLTLVRHQNSAVSSPDSRVVRQSQFSIGRATDNDWVLDDPDMVLSRRHCVIEVKDGAYYLTDTSANGVYINHDGQPLGRNNSVRLNHGDSVLIGDYQLSVQLSAAPDSPGAADLSLLDSTDFFSESPDPLNITSPGDQPPARFDAPPPAAGDALDNSIGLSEPQPQES